MLQMNPNTIHSKIIEEIDTTITLDSDERGMNMENKQFKFNFFPTPAPGETIFSVICRLRARSGLQEKIILNALTGQRHKAAILHAIPGYLNRISAVLPFEHPWKDTTYAIAKHTTLPYFLYFDEPEHRQKWVREVADTIDCQSLGLSLGLSMYKGQAYPAHPRYCPKCAQEQLQTFGFTFFLREHQLPWVFVCWKHYNVLSHGCNVCGPYPIKKIGLSMPGTCACSSGAVHLNVLSIQPSMRAPLQWIAEQSTFMVRSEGTACGRIRKLLRDALIGAGLSRGKILDSQAIAGALSHRFGEKFLYWSGYPVWTGGRPSAWLLRMFNNKGMDEIRSPLLPFLFVIGVLFGSVQKFESVSGTIRPQQSRDIGAKEKKYYSGISSQMGDTISKFAREGKWGVDWIAKKLELTAGQVTAELHRRQIRIPLSQSKRIRIGENNLNEIIRLLQLGTEKKGLMSQFELSVQLLRDIELDQPGLNAVHFQAVHQRRKEAHRDIVRELLKDNSDLGRANVQNLKCSTYEFLLRYDKSWFHANVPKKAIAGYKASRKNILDWSTIDRQKADELESIVREAYLSQKKPVWITQTWCLRTLKILNKYIANPLRFPMVTAVMDELVETPEAFAERKITWIFNHWQADDTVSVNRLRRRVGLPAKNLRSYKSLVIELARKHDIAIPSNSFFVGH
jgi:hypothetical protein